MRTKTKWEATERNGPGALLTDTSLWEILRFVAYWFKSNPDKQFIIIRKSRS